MSYEIIEQPEIGPTVIGKEPMKSGFKMWNFHNHHASEHSCGWTIDSIHVFKPFF